jgi:hypothetical protein
MDQFASSAGGGPLAEMGAAQAKAGLEGLRKKLEGVKAAIVAYQPGENIKKAVAPLQQAVGAAADAVSGAAQQGGVVARLRKFFGGGDGGAAASQPQLSSYRPGSMMAQMAGGGASSGGGGGGDMKTLLGQALSSGSLDSGVLALMNNIERFTDGFNKMFPGN